MPADEPLRLYAAVLFGWAKDTRMVSMGVTGMTRIWVQVTEVPMEHTSVPGDEAPLHDTWVVSWLDTFPAEMSRTVAQSPSHFVLRALTTITLIPLMLLPVLDPFPQALTPLPFTHAQH
jgi:hypothetical protein